MKEREIFSVLNEINMIIESKQSIKIYAGKEQLVYIKE